MLQLEFSQIDYIPPVQSVCSEGSLVSLVSYYPPAGRRGPVCTRNARQAVLSKTLNAKSLHQCVKARNSSEWQGLWGTTHSSHLCCCCWEKPLQGKGKGPGEQKSWSSTGRTLQALWGVVENCLPSPGSLQPFVIHTHTHPILSSRSASSAAFWRTQNYQTKYLSLTRSGKARWYWNIFALGPLDACFNCVTPLRMIWFKSDCLVCMVINSSWLAIFLGY